MNHNVKQINHGLKLQCRKDDDFRLDRYNVLRVSWKSEIKEDHQLSPGRPSNALKRAGPSSIQMRAIKEGSKVINLDCVASLLSLIHDKLTP